MTGPGTINPNFMDATHGVGESVSIKGEARAPNPELGNVTKPSAWALAGRVFLGIISIGFSELLRAIVNAVTARSVSQPRLNAVQPEQHENAVQPESLETAEQPESLGTVDQPETLGTAEPLPKYNVSNKLQTLLDSDYGLLSSRTIKIPAQLSETMGESDVTSLVTTLENSNATEKEIIDAFVELGQNESSQMPEATTEQERHDNVLISNRNLLIKQPSLFNVLDGMSEEKLESLEDKLFDYAQGHPESNKACGYAQSLLTYVLRGKDLPDDVSPTHMTGVIEPSDSWRDIAEGIKKSNELNPIVGKIVSDNIYATPYNHIKEVAQNYQQVLAFDVDGVKGNRNILPIDNIMTEVMKQAGIIGESFKGSFKGSPKALGEAIGFLLLGKCPNVVNAIYKNIFSLDDQIFKARLVVTELDDAFIEGLHEAFSAYANRPKESV